MKKHAKILWFTGLSGAGKTTLAEALSAKLLAEGFHSYLLDADILRKTLNKDLGYDLASRRENLRRAAEVASLFCDAGVISLCCFISPTEEIRSMIRGIIGKDRMIEIYVNAPIEICEQRDVKGLYKKARTGLIPDFTGISSPFEPPANPDIELATHLLTVDACVAQIFDRLLKELALQD